MVKDYDVLLLQEAFDVKPVMTTTYRKDLLEKLYKVHYSHKHYMNQTKNPFKTDDGLMILSKYPLTSKEGLVFKNKGIMGDKSSRKGVISAVVDFNDTKILVATTHMQASYTPDQEKEKKNRDLQRKEMEQWLKPQIKGMPVIIAGDFNVDSDKAEYNDLKTLMNDIDGLKDITMKEDGTHHITYQKWEPPSQRKREKKFDDKLSKKRGVIAVSGTGSVKPASTWCHFDSAAFDTANYEQNSLLRSGKRGLIWSDGETKVVRCKRGRVGKVEVQCVKGVLSVKGQECERDVCDDLFISGSKLSSKKFKKKAKKGIAIEKFCTDKNYEWNKELVKGQKVYCNKWNLFVDDENISHIVQNHKAPLFVLKQRALDYVFMNNHCALKLAHLFVDPFPLPEASPRKFLSDHWGVAMSFRVGQEGCKQ